MAKKKKKTGPRNRIAGVQPGSRNRWKPPKGMPKRLERLVRAGRACGRKVAGGWCEEAPCPEDSADRRERRIQPPYRCPAHLGAGGGGQKGNKSAVKHGIYACALLPGEELLHPDADSLDDEITITKIRLKRALRWEARQEAAREAGITEADLDLEQRETTVDARGGASGGVTQKTVRRLPDHSRAIGAIVTQLCRLVSAREVMTGGDPLDAQAKAALARDALAEAAAMMGGGEA